MKALEIRDLTDEELAEKYEDSRKELLHLRVQKATGQLEQSGRLREVRRDIARIKTVLSQRSSAVGSEA